MYTVTKIWEQSCRKLSGKNI